MPLLSSLASMVIPLVIGWDGLANVCLSRTSLLSIPATANSLPLTCYVLLWALCSPGVSELCDLWLVTCDVLFCTAILSLGHGRLWLSSDG